MRTLLLAVLLAVTPTAMAMACSKPSDAAALEREMVAWVNQEREARGLARLAPSPQLAAAAQQHACDMATRDFFSHKRAGGPSMADRAKAHGYRFGKMVENLASAQEESVRTAAGLWRNSPPHWANILMPDLRDIGISVTRGGGKVYWVMKAGRAR